LELLRKGKMEHFVNNNSTEFKLMMKLSIDSRITYITANSSVVIDYKSEEIIGTHISTIMHHEDYQNLINKCNTSNEEVETKLYRIRKKDGTFLWVEMVFTVIKKDTLAEEIILFIRQPDPRNELESFLLEDEKLKIAGQLAAGVAHEIKNPLTSLKGFIQLMKAETVPNKYYLEIMEGEIQRLELISNELLVLAKPHKHEVEMHDLLKIVKEVTLLLEAEALQKSIQFHLLEQDTALMILCDRNKVKQVLINIIKNGIESMEQPGFITIRLSKNDRCTQVSISDQGCGIPEEYLQKLGTPFFSTKTSGNGLGLMVCQKIIAEHNGKITVQSSKETGTTFTIQIPLIIN
jgi:PAS domain S-box-containing protein